MHSNMLNCRTSSLCAGQRLDKVLRRPKVVQRSAHVRSASQVQKCPEMKACEVQSPDLLARRNALGAIAVAASAVVLNALPLATAKAEECTYQKAPNGLQFCDIVEGTGPEPVQGAMIRAHYTGRLASNGKVFDSSYNRRRPLSFKIGVRQVIQGWDLGILGTEGVPPMKEGGKRKLVIPPELAYGAGGAGGGLIPPNATLIFDVEYLGKAGMR